MSWLRARPVLIATLGTALGITIALPPRPLLVWNASASAPIGLYRVGGHDDIAPGDMVVARVPTAWRQLAARRHYLPANVPLVKRVVGVPGDSICALGNEVSVNGRPIAERQTRDAAGRPMRWWSGCITLRQGALFLLMDSPASFDGRYFGPTEAGDVVGEARLTWAR